MKYIITIVLLIFTLKMYRAQAMRKDTLESWYSQFSQLSNLSLSPDGKWAAMKKNYNNNSDTALVVRTDNANTILLKFTCAGIPRFTKTSVYGAPSKGHFDFVNLKTGKKYSFDNVRNAVGLSDLDHFAVLDKDRNITLYNSTGSSLFTVQNIEPFLISDKKKNLFAQGKGNEIVDLSGDHHQVIYSTKNTIDRFLLTPSARHLFIIERDVEKNMLLSIFDTQKRRLTSIRMSIQKAGSYCLITEINKGDSYLIESTSSEDLPNSKLVDLWYGNETDLANRNKKISKEFYLWKSGQEQLMRLPNDRFPQLASMNSNRYFFAYYPSKGHNYIHWRPQYQMHMYDRISNTHHFLGNLRGEDLGSPKIYCSPHSSYVMASEDGKKWTLFSILDGSKKLIDKESLNNPAFSTDGKYIIFEGADDLWKYDISLGVIKAMKVSTGLSPRIINFDERKTQDLTYFYLRTVDLNKPLLIELKNKDDLSVSYQLHKEGKKTVILFLTPDKITDNIAYDQNMKSFYTIEENMNLPSKLVKYSKKTTQILYEIKNLDKNGEQLKKEIVHFTNSEGRKLKGILYYPIGFNPDRKYPMITHIYQVQSDAANDYLLPDFSLDSFNIRTLLQRGYFVYIPDIVYGESGTGLSALDCVNNALDALIGHPNINNEKIGLIGHSHGGYETNFIATHSSRFATYISGSGNSDIIRSYFSYNYNFTSPFYFQFENGQYEMGKPFSEAKERYLKNSPILNVEKVNAPILLWAGKQDENIAWDQVMEFYIGLRRNRKSVIAIFYPNQGHTLSSAGMEIKDMSRRQLEWWDYFLKDKKDIPWINKQMKE